MNKRYEKERFESISLKRSVAKKFWKYGKAISKSQPITPLLMLEFLTPKKYGDSGPSNRTLENTLKQRMNAIIAIIKNIEKNQTKPTTAIMASLFSYANVEEEDPLITVNKKYNESPF